MMGLSLDKCSLFLVACVVWAACIGMSVPLELINSIFLNSEALKSERQWNAIYITGVEVIFGGLELIPLAIKGAHPVMKPKRWWHVCGGICTLPVFFTISAGAILGTQCVLIVQLAAQLTTFFIIDCIDGKVMLTNCAKVVALFIIFAGVVLENLHGISSAGGIEALVSLLMVALSGCGFALQAKCNNALANDLGSPARATIVSACVYSFCSLPVIAYIYWGQHVAPKLNPQYWYLWCLAGFQSAFYIGSFAYLPTVMGFTSCYVIVLVAKVFTSLAVDASGLTGEVIPVSFTRVCAVLIVLLGCITYNFSCSRSDRVSDPETSLQSAS